MNTRIPWTIALLLFSILFVSLDGPGAWAQKTGAASEVIPATGTPAGLTASEEEQGMTLYDLLKAGGWVMYIIGALSILALGLTIYYSITLTERNVVSNELVMQIRHYLQDRRYDDIARLCRRSKGMFGKVILAGVTRGAIDPGGVSSTMEAVGRREAEALMRKARHLSDIATIAPMLGLLGTVLGMINAFNFIAFDISAVKPVALASAVAQALVTTAAGLIVAIPCMGIFFYFRGKVQFLVGRVEEVAVEIAEALSSTDATKRKTTIRKG
ncbi:MAG: MotA/TolQ/ExbB proton channel family protein [Candidatus Omnitrophota bacterium]